MNWLRQLREKLCIAKEKKQAEYRERSLIRSMDHERGAHVLLMIFSLYGGGAERVVCTLANEFARFYPVTILFYDDKGRTYPLDSRIELIKLPEFEFSEEEEHEMWLRHVRFIKRNRHVTASISFMYFMNRLNVLSGGRGTVICSERNNPMRKEPEHMDDIKNIYKRADRVVFQSDTVRSMFGPEVRRNSVIIPNPVRIACSGSEKKKNRIVTLGRLHPQKNHELLIRAFAQVYAKHKEYTLSIYGDGDLKSSLQDLADSLGVAQSVRLHGNVEEVHRDVSDAQIFVLSSDYEGMSNALLECMAMGMACISTACEGSVDVISSGRNGLIVPVGDEEALRDAMLTLIEDRKLADRLAHEAALTAEGFRADKVAKKWVALFDRSGRKARRI